MDESLRNQQRQANRSGDPTARLRLALDCARGDRHGDVLSATEGLTSGDALALRAAAFFGLERFEDAWVAGRAAEQSRSGSLDPAVAGALAERIYASALHEPLDHLLCLARAAALGNGAAQTLAEATHDPSPWVQAQAARLPALRGTFLASASGLVRWARDRPWNADPPPGEEQPTRLFGGRGPDFRMGVFVAFQTSCDARLAFLDSAFMRALDALLVGAGRRFLAFGEGYGLGFAAAAPRGDLEERIDRVNAAGALPFRLKACGMRPFDALEGVDPQGSPLSATDEALARRFARDLARNTARRGVPPDMAPPYHRILARFQPGNAPPTAEELEPVLAEARSRYSPVGMRALELFMDTARADAVRHATFNRRGTDPGA